MCKTLCCAILVLQMRKPSLKDIRLSDAKSGAFYPALGCLADGLNHKFKGPDATLVRTWPRGSSLTVDLSSEGTSTGRGLLRASALPH